MKHIRGIDGLRGFLALWVLTCHALLHSGFQDGNLPGPAFLLLRGPLAVQVFIILSGFVIFHLLDTKKEAWWPYITRRFFRLYPLFILVFLVAVPLSWVSLLNLRLNPFLSAEYARTLLMSIVSERANLGWHVGLHALLLHGTLPYTWLPDSAHAFLGPAWSLSLEWQFYLVAPLLLFLAKGRRTRFLLVASCIALYALRRMLPPSLLDGWFFLPLHPEFFFIGAASYFVYALPGRRRLPADSLFPPALLLSLLILVIPRSFALLPLSLWIAFFALILEPEYSRSSRFLLKPLFENPVARYLGGISYSLYLTHVPVIIGVHFFLLKNFQWVSLRSFALATLGLTFVLALAISHCTYTFIEKPGIRLGNRVARRWKRPGNP